MAGQLHQCTCISFMLIVLVYQVKGIDEEATSRDLKYISTFVAEDRAARKQVDLRRPPFCYYKPVRGECSLKLPRYYYDSTHNRCRVFLYSGCGGNTNNFLTRPQCIEVCQ
ncbi:kunitz-type serine protease inhibitor 2-like [Bicyclus anynana]|uniref:Kunitz-type serine protease inhibitor 2-like n=1 Tax=Bicyclus anynana TaxID=110368 RepID=A0ABM3LMC0_BICAN|nr:kunitz-type serine protease inhibitor 2-like [Bicyclus anynana]